VTCKIRHVDRTVNDKTSLDNILLSIDSKKLSITTVVEIIFYCWLIIKTISHHKVQAVKYCRTVDAIDSPLHLSIFHKWITTVAVAWRLQCMEAQINICPEIYRTMMTDIPKGASGIVYIHACWPLANVHNRTHCKKQP